MYCIDTNILIRCITMDDPIQSPRAIAFLKKAIAGKHDIYVSDVVVLEVAWVLQKRFGYDASRIRIALQPLVMDPSIRLDHPSRLLAALETFAAHPSSLNDAYVAMCALEVPGAVVVTFDRDFQSMSVPNLEP
jgi:predicted nucleic acid-binding protein